MMMDISATSGIMPPMPSPSMPVFDPSYGRLEDIQLVERFRYTGMDSYQCMPTTNDSQIPEVLSTHISPSVLSVQPSLTNSRENSPSKPKRSLGSEDNASLESVSAKSSSTTSSTASRKRRRQTSTEATTSQAGKGHRRSSTTDATLAVQNDVQCNSLDYSQALSSLQCQADNFSQNVMHQFFGPGSDVTPQSMNTFDVGILLSVVDAFVALVSNLATTNTDRSMSLPSVPQTHWYNNATRRIVPKRAHTHTAAIPKSDNLEVSELDAGLLHLLFGCHNRLIFAFHVTLDAITKQVAGGQTSATGPLRLDLFSIGSYRAPEGAEINVLLHLYAISHQLDRLDTNLRRHILAGPKQSVVTFFQGKFCAEKRQQLGVENLKSRALEEAAESKTLLDSKIETILNEIRGLSIV
jgi:hypothetical protein